MTFEEIRKRYNFNTSLATSRFIETLEQEGIPLEEKFIDMYVASIKYKKIKDRIVSLHEEYSSRGACLCGRDESCDNCDSDSSKNRILKSLSSIIQEHS